MDIKTSEKICDLCQECGFDKTFCNKKWAALEDVKNLLDEEIAYLQGHVLRANEGIPINKERVESWLFQTKKLRKDLVS